MARVPFDPPPLPSSLFRVDQWWRCLWWTAHTDHPLHLRVRNRIGKPLLYFALGWFGLTLLRLRTGSFFRDSGLLLLYQRPYFLYLVPPILSVILAAALHRAAWSDRQGLRTVPFSTDTRLSASLLAIIIPLFLLFLSFHISISPAFMDYAAESYQDGEIRRIPFWATRLSRYAIWFSFYSWTTIFLMTITIVLQLSLISVQDRRHQFPILVFYAFVPFLLFWLYLRVWRLAGYPEIRIFSLIFGVNGKFPEVHRFYHLPREHWTFWEHLSFEWRMVRAWCAAFLKDFVFFFPLVDILLYRPALRRARLRLFQPED